MTNSESKPEIVRIIEEVFEKISEEYLHIWIDEPIEKAAASFEFDREALITHQTFIQITGDFVRHIYGQGPCCWRKMSIPEANAEALAILESGYQSPIGRGYDYAFSAASNQQFNGLEYVLAQMAGYISAMARTRYIRWVLASQIELSDWPKRCLIAEFLLKQWEPFLPSNLRACSPAQLAYWLSDLINSMLTANKMVSGMLRQHRFVRLMKPPTQHCR